MTAPHGEGVRPLRLTNLGELARTFGVTTPPSWFQDQAKDALREAENSGEWAMLLIERRDGLDALLTAVQEHGFDWLAQVANGRGVRVENEAGDGQR